MQDACHSYVIFEFPQIVKNGGYSAKIYSEWLTYKYKYKVKVLNIGWVNEVGLTLVESKLT